MRTLVSFRPSKYFRINVNHTIIKVAFFLVVYLSNRATYLTWGCQAWCRLLLGGGLVSRGWRSDRLGNGRWNLEGGIQKLEPLPFFKILVDFFCRIFKVWTSNFEGWNWLKRTKNYKYFVCCLLRGFIAPSMEYEMYAFPSNLPPPNSFTLLVC